MKKNNVAIIGAGQSGIQLAIHLLKTNHFNVSLFSEHSAEQIYQGRILSSQVMFNNALQKERDLGLNFWDDECPKNTTFSCAIGELHSSQPKFCFSSKVKTFQSIDQRLKYSRWLNEFKQLGGNLVIKEMTLSHLTALTEQHALVIIATGKSKLSQLFEVDQTRSTFTSPQRVLACLYVQGMYPLSKGVRANIIPGIGEYFTTPGLTYNGHCEMMLFEGLPGGPWDCWKNMATPDETLKQAVRLLKQYVPWEGARCNNIKLSDNNALLFGQIVPLIRKPITIIPNGKAILGIADTVVLNDPIAGQGANLAAKISYWLAEQIIQKNNQVFDKEWMANVANEIWMKYSKPATQLSTLLLSPPPHLLNILMTATHNHEVANQFAEGFNDPSSLSWLN
jgi:hypothetical protein